MPESSQDQLAQFSKNCTEIDETYDDSLPDIGELLGFRITGGRDFFMPITIFHVKENSRAEKAKLKLGDSILTVNGKDTSDMTLVEANRYLAKVSAGDVALQVAKFTGDEDDDEDVQTIEEVILEGPRSLEQKLRMMQKQLLEMTDIPPQIQAKLATVTKALEQFMTMDGDALDAEEAEEEEEELSWREPSEEFDEMGSEKQFSSIPEEDENEAEAEESFEHFELEHSTRETSYSLDDLEEQYKKLQEADDDDEQSICDSIKSEELVRLEEEKRKKNEKILKLEKSWQKLCLNTKTIHKRSNCHLVPSVALINNKISQLNESKVISFYARKRCPQND